MEHKDFDKFIKSNTEKDLTPPEALAWENMNIPLPQKKKRRGFYFFWFGLLGLILAGGYFIISPSTTNTKIDIIQNSMTISNQKNIELNPKLNIENKDLQQDIYKSENSTIKTAEVEAVKAKPYSNNQKSINQVSSKNISIPFLKTKNFNPIFINTNPEIDKTNSTFTTILEDLKKEEFSTEKINPIVSFLFLLKTDTVKLNLPTFFETPMDPDADEKKGKKGISLYFSFGMNYSKNNYVPNYENLDLHKFVKSAFGNGASLGVRFDLKKNLFLESGFSYQRIHSTFEFRKPLATLIDTVAFQKTYRTRHVFHNNYFSYLELNVGIGKTFLFGKNWGSDLAFRFNPSFKIKNEGKLLDKNGLVFKIEDFDALPKVFLSADVGVNLFFKKNNNKVFTEINFKQNISKLKLLENSNLTIQPTTLTIKLGILRSF